MALVFFLYSKSYLKGFSSQATLVNMYIIVGIPHSRTPFSKPELRATHKKCISLFLYLVDPAHGMSPIGIYRVNSRLISQVVVLLPCSFSKHHCGLPIDLWGCWLINNTSDHLADVSLTHGGSHI